MMKRCLPMLLMPLCLWATEPVPMPPQEEAPFRVVIEEVAEPAPAAEETPVDDPETPVAESYTWTWYDAQGNILRQEVTSD